MKATPHAIPDVILLEPKVFEDDRGFFFESFSQAKFEAAIGILTTVMMFFPLVFYPATTLPEEFRPWLMANPLTFIIEQAREVPIWGRLPNWTGMGGYTLVAVAVAWAGYAWFQKTRKLHEASTDLGITGRSVCAWSNGCA
jgi:hypothetical protein